MTLQHELEQAQAEVARYREREAYFAKALGVTDGGQYRADWPSSIERVLRDCKAKDEALTKAADTFRDFHAAMTLLGHDLSASAAAIAEEATRKAIGPDRPAPCPIPMILHCPECKTQHVDEGIWATTRLHKSHLCAACNHTWRVADVPTVGVATLPSVARDRCCDRCEEPNIMDAPDGPVCHCGKPSAFESGVCTDCGNWDLARWQREGA
jgi:hypothetical protein